MKVVNHYVSKEKQFKHQWISHQKSWQPEGNGNPLQCSCLGPRDGVAWWAAVYGVAQSRTRLKRLSTSMSLLIFSLMALSIPDRRVLRSLIIIVSESHSIMSDSLRPHGLYSPRNSPGQKTGVGSWSLLPGIFPTQGSHPGLSSCWQILYQLSH